MSDPNATFVLGETPPANFNRRAIPWGAKIGDSVPVETMTYEDEGATYAPSMRVQSLIAEMDASEEGKAAPVEVADPAAEPAAQAAAPAPAVAPVPVTPSADSARIDKLERMLDEALKAMAPKPAAEQAPAQAVTSVSVSELRKNPMAALRAAGIDPETLATYMPGANITPEIQVSQSLAAMKSEMEQRFVELAEREDKYANVQRQAQLATKTDETLKAVDKVKFPTAAKIAAKNPTWVKDRILEGIEMARARNFEMSVEEALTGLESHWANFTSFVSDPVTPAAAPVAAATSSVPVVVPSEAASQKQPPRPIRSKWDRTDDETSRRTNEVLREYFVRNSSR